MQTYGCSGTLGDTYINLCILCSIATQEPIICKHYTLHSDLHALIRSIYSLVPNIHVDFVNTRDTKHPRIHGAFAHHESYGKVLADPNKWCIFPQFAFPILSNLPEHYVVLNPQSGRKSQERIMRPTTIHKTISTAKYPIIVIGTSKTAKEIQGKNIINLVNKTSLLEAMGIVSQSQQLISCQGLMCFVAMSYKIRSAIYIKQKSDTIALKIRTPKQWEQYGGLINE